MAEVKMRVSVLTLAAFATLSMAGSIVSHAAGDPAPADTGCLYRDAHYGPGAVICVAPRYAQQCGDKSTWTTPSTAPPYDNVCAGAQTSVPGIPPAQCIYHDVKYAPGAMICVAPSFGMNCTPDGGWSRAAGVEEACKKAQIPAPTGPPASAK